MELVGGVMLCCAFLFLGMIASSSEKLSCDRLQALIRLVTHLRNSISGTRKQLGAIFADYDDRILFESGFLGVMNNPKSTSDYTIRWEEAIKLLIIPKDAEKAALAAGRELGRLDLKTQTEQLLYLERLLEGYLKEQRQNLEGKQKVYKSVSLLAGVIITILLI